MWELALPITAAGSGAAWAELAARRAGERPVRFALRALLGGAAAFGLALLAYDVAGLAGMEVRWELLVRGDLRSALWAAVIGIIEEGAKLAGILLVVEGRLRTRTIVAAAVGVAAGFSSFEALVVLGRDPSAGALARAALGPVAHALLAMPLALGVAAAQGRRRPALKLLPALAAAAALHGAGDLSLALPWLGHPGYALALATPAFLVFARARAARRLAATAATAASAVAAAAAPVPPAPRTQRVRSAGGP